MATQLDDRLGELADLLDELDGPLRHGRARLLAELLERGYTVEALREAHRLDRLAVLLLEEALRESASMSARDVAAACDIDAAEVLRAAQTMGIAVHDPDVAAFDPPCVATIEVMKAARAFGLPEPAIHEMLTVLGRHMWQLAADIEVIVGNQLGEQGDTEYELAHRYADAGRALAPLAVPLIGGVFTAHLRERMRDIFVTPDEAAFGSLRALAEVTVAFVDVVGFTDLGERVDAGQLRSVAAGLVALAEGVVALPVRIVKTVGDAILLMARDTEPLVDALAAILAAAENDDAFPPVHVGVARGSAYVGGADVYGAPVNLASRITMLAPAGRIWGDAAVAGAGGKDPRWVSIGKRDVKGHAQPVEVFDLHREESVGRVEQRRRGR
jgi:adenylate cyclase